MNRFHALDGYNKKRDSQRRCAGADALKKNNISYSCPQPGHYKIDSQKCVTLMFYPKTGCIIWKTHRKGYQHKFTNEDEGKLMRKLKELI